MAERNEGICLVTNYPPSRRTLGGSGWVDRRYLPVLQSWGEVDVVSVTGPPGTWSEHGATVSAAGDVPLEVRSDRGQLLDIAARMLISAEPYLTTKFTSAQGWPEAVALLRKRASGRRVVTSGWPSLVLASSAGVPVDAHIAHNVESVIAAEHSPLPLRLLGEGWRLSRREKGLLRIPRQVFTLSRTDAAWLRAWGVPSRQIPIPLRPRAAARGSRAVGFIGKAGWPPNKRALAQLLGPLHTTLERTGVPVPFVLAGTGTDQYAGHPRVVAAGPVAEEADFYRQVSLVMVPRFGVSTGISVKMLEAAEHGVSAVVPSSLARAVDPDGPWLIADDIGAMADVVARWWFGAAPPDPHDWIRRTRLSDARAALAPVLGV